MHRSNDPRDAPSAYEPPPYPATSGRPSYSNGYPPYDPNEYHPPQAHPGGGSFAGFPPHRDPPPPSSYGYPPASNVYPPLHGNFQGPPAPAPSSYYYPDGYPPPAPHPYPSSVPPVHALYPPAYPPSSAYPPPHSHGYPPVPERGYYHRRSPSPRRYDEPPSYDRYPPPRDYPGHVAASPPQHGTTLVRPSRRDRSMSPRRRSHDDRTYRRSPPPSTRYHDYRIDRRHSSHAGFKRSAPFTPIKDPKLLAETCSLFVGNIPFHYNDQDVRKLFSPYGSIRLCTVSKNSYTGQNRGFGFVEFHKREDAERAFQEVNGKSLEPGRELRIDWDLGLAKKKVFKDAMKKEGITEEGSSVKPMSDIVEGHVGDDDGKGVVSESKTEHDVASPLSAVVHDTSELKLHQEDTLPASKHDVNNVGDVDHDSFPLNDIVLEPIPSLMTQSELHPVVTNTATHGKAVRDETSALTESNHDGERVETANSEVHKARTHVSDRAVEQVDTNHERTAGVWKD